jgi:probable DNA repair protein
MLMRTCTLADLLAASDTLVLCATARLSVSLRQRHAACAQAEGHTQWPTLACQTVTQWLQQCHEAWTLTGAAPAPLQRMPLSAMQERLLWERVIQADLGEDARYLFDLAALSRSAQEAHALTVTWQVALPVGQETSEEARRFGHWQSRFLALCDGQGWIDAARCQANTVAAFSGALNGEDVPAMAWPRQVVWAGFSRFNPVELALQAALQSRGVACLELVADPSAEQLHVQSWPDSRAECLAAALWARDRLQANPLARIGIVVPDLAALRHPLQDTLDTVLQPIAMRASQSETPAPYNISLGQPLSQHPLVHTALALLDVVLSPHDITQADAGRLLRDPFWSQGQGEAAPRALLEAQLRTHLPPQTRLSDFVDTVARVARQRHWAVPVLQSHLDALLSTAGQASGLRQLPSAWSRTWPTWLQALGWLHQRRLSSHEYQAREAWADELRALARLDEVLGPVDGRNALLQLRRLCRDHVFQPETEGQPRLQVLGLLEASGLRFDAVWVMGLTDTAWPPPPRPNPLLPALAQRQARSPNASAEVQQAFALGIHQRLLQAAPEVVFSWPRTEGAAELSPSPLLPPTPPDQHHPAPVSPHWGWAHLQRPNTALAPAVEDAWAPPVLPEEAVRGGTGLLRTQAICPAWAFYRFRLGAGLLETPSEGLDPRQRGNLLHAALERFWQAVQTSTALRALGKDATLSAIEAAVDGALAAHDQAPRQVALKPRLRTLERQRLVRLLSAWLAVERSRGQDFEVIAQERGLMVTIEGLPIQVKVDRIDQLADGDLLVIDYKTGAKVDTRNWASERLTEPQLPIYAAVAPPPEGPVTGVVFAKVNRKEPGWAGVAASDGVLPQVMGLSTPAGRKVFSEAAFPDWASVLQHWRTRLQAVAAEVVAGDAGVRFADDKALQHCDVLPLLRLAERQAQLAQPWPLDNATPGEPG